jgi:hypothetical protein
MMLCKGIKLYMQLENECILKIYGLIWISGGGTRNTHQTPIEDNKTSRESKRTMLEPSILTPCTCSKRGEETRTRGGGFSAPPPSTNAKN